MRTFLSLLALTAAAGVLLADDKTKDEKKTTEPKTVTTNSGLKYIELKEGTGERAREGDTVSVHCTGWLKDGTKFFSTLDNNEPMEVTIGKSPLIKGWTEGLQGIRAGGKRKLIIPPELGYGANGRPPKIPGNAELTFEIELLKIK